MAIRNALKKMTGEKAGLTAAILIIAGCALRLLFLEALPFGLKPDEASAGYEAWALLHSGIDRNGNSWPVLFVSWGSGQNVLMSYLAMPFVALLGLRPLSIRLPNALAGCLSLILMWKLGRRCRGEKFGLLALFLMVINPWHIMASRWALESNLLPALLLGACWYLSLAEEKPGALIGAAVCLGLAPYAYGTVFFLLPPFLLWILLRLRRSLKWKPTLLSAAVFALLIWPIALTQAINILKLDQLQILGITFPRLTEGRQAATSVLGGGGLSDAVTNFTVFLDMLHNGDDGNLYNALPFWRGGILYFFGLPLAVMGVFVCLLQRRERKEEWPVPALLACSLLCAALILGNINRLNMIWIPLIYFSAVGLDRVFQSLKARSLIPLAGILVCFCYFAYSYVSAFAPPGAEDYHPEIGRAIAAAKNRNPHTLYVGGASEPYIYALFYGRTPPETFAETVVYSSPDADFRPVDRFGGYEFTDPERADLFVLPLEETMGKEVLEEYGRYAVCQ